MVNYEEAIRKPFTDLKGLLIGIILSIIPIVNFTIVTGFALENSGLGKTKPSKKMPEWTDWGNLFVKGLAAFVIGIIYMIPAIAVIAIGFGMAAGGIIGTVLGFMLTPEMMGQIGIGSQYQNMFAQSWYMLLPTLLVLAPILIVGFILALIAMYLTPMAVLNYVKSNRFSSAFDITAIAKKAFTSNYVIVWVVLMILGAIVNAVLAFVPWLGSAIALFVMAVISYSLYGQVYREVR